MLTALLGTNNSTWTYVAAATPLPHTIYLQQLPEGIWLASSDTIPGLFVEGDTETEARTEAQDWAKELLVDNCGLDPAEDIKLIFANISAGYAR
jgi:predicted RNase H-like HicB family nuclease